MSEIDFNQNNPYCHAGMVCHDGCMCSRADGICHCKMISEKKCACDGYCGAQKQ